MRISPSMIIVRKLRDDGYEPINLLAKEFCDFADKKEFTQYQMDKFRVLGFAVEVQA